MYINTQVLTQLWNETYYCICPNRSAVRECKGLGARLKILILKPVVWLLQGFGCTSKNFNIKAYRLVSTRVVYIRIFHVFMVTGTTWTFTYMAVAICTCVTPKGAWILLYLDDLLMFYQAFGVNLSFSRYGIFVAGGVCASIRSHCVSKRTYMVHVTCGELCCTWFQSQWQPRVIVTLA